MAVNKLIFKDAEKARDAILDSQKKEIAALYDKWADEIGERANYYSHKSTTSSVVSERQMRELQKQIRASSQEVSNEVYSMIKKNMYTRSGVKLPWNLKLADGVKIYKKQVDYNAQRLARTLTQHGWVNMNRY